MKFYYKLFLYTFLPFLVFSQPPGQLVDQTTIDIQNYWNSSSNQLFVDTVTNETYLGYMWSTETENITPIVRVKNISTGQLMEIGEASEYGFGMVDIRRHSWGNLLVTLTSGGIPWILTDDWANGVSIFIESETGLGVFEELFWVNEAPVSEPEYALSGWTIVDPSGRIHSLIYDGWGFGFVYKYSDDGGFVFSSAVIIAYNGDEIFPNNEVLEGTFFNQPFGVAFNSDGDGHITVAVTDQGGDIFLYQSITGGETWEEPLNLTNYGTEFGSEFIARPDRFIDGIFDINGHLHLVWEASYWMDIWQSEERHPWPGFGEDLPYPADKRGRLIHWSETTGFSTVAVSQSPQVDLNSSFGSITGREKGCMISMPSISLNENTNELIVGYTQYSEEEVEITPEGKYLGYGELFLTKSTDDGLSWTIPEDITLSGDLDERHFLLNEYLINNDIHMMYFADDLPGYNIFNEFGTPSVTDVYYHSMILPENTIAIYGCTDSEATNYNSEANMDDGTCNYFSCCADVYGCNYDESCLSSDPQDCDYEVCYGCTDPEATNYDPMATIDDDSCLYSADFALNFDGTNDFVLIEDHADFDFSSNYTLEAWIFTEEFDWLSGIISKYQTSGANGWILRLHSVEPFDGIEFDELKSPTGILELNQWVHVAAVNNSGQRYLYINGEEVNLTGNPVNVTSNVDDVRIASDFNSRFFNGVIDEVRIWNTGLSQLQIQNNMNESLIGDEEGLVAYFNFNEGIGDTLYDLTVNGHHGVIYNEPSWVSGIGGEVLLGDVNFDGNINILDCVMMVAFIVGFEEGTDFQLTASDANGDGILNVLDVILVINWVLEA